MQPCDRCGQEVEDLIAQPDGKLLCRPCHLGLGSGFSEEEYNELRVSCDADPNFKKLRHRFWALGLVRRFRVLVSMGYAVTGESLMEKIERYRLYRIKADGNEGTLVAMIEEQEAEILAENEKSEYIRPQDIPTGPVSGRAHAGRGNLRQGPTNPNPWEDSQK